MVYRPPPRQMVAVVAWVPESPNGSVYSRGETGIFEENARVRKSLIVGDFIDWIPSSHYGILLRLERGDTL